MKSCLLLLSGLILLGVGCASTDSTARAGEPAYSLGPPAGEPLLVRGAAVTGPSSSLVISDNALRGRFRDLPVDLKWNFQELTGSVASRGTRLELAEGDDTRIWGSFGGSPVDLTMDREWMKGRVGMCTYELRRYEDWYLGRRDCGGPLEPGIRVAFPEPLLERPLGERAALMTLTLINFNFMSTYSPTLAPSRRMRPRSFAPNGRPDSQ